jgi:hypothetical protein
VWLSLQSLPDNVPSDQRFWKCGRETTFLLDPNIRPWVEVLVSRNKTRTAEDRECLALFCVCSRHEVRGKPCHIEAFRSHICARGHLHQIIYIRPIQIKTCVACGLKMYPAVLQNMYWYFLLLQNSSESVWKTMQKYLLHSYVIFQLNSHYTWWITYRIVWLHVSMQYSCTVAI